MERARQASRTAPVGPAQQTLAAPMGLKADLDDRRGRMGSWPTSTDLVHRGVHRRCHGLKQKPGAVKWLPGSALPREDSNL